MKTKDKEKKTKEKVFCINCQHIYSIFHYEIGKSEDKYYCSHPGLSIKKDTWLKPGVERGRISPKVANRNNDCNLYEEIPPEYKEEQKIPCPPGIIKPMPKKGMILPYKIFNDVKKWVT